MVDQAKPLNSYQQAYITAENWVRKRLYRIEPGKPGLEGYPLAQISLWTAYSSRTSEPIDDSEIQKIIRFRNAAKELLLDLN